MRIRINLDTVTSGTVHARPNWVEWMLGASADDFAVWSDARGHWFRLGMHGDVRVKPAIERRLEAKARAMAAGSALRARLEVVR